MRMSRADGMNVYSNLVVTGSLTGQLSQLDVAGGGKITGSLSLSNRGDTIRFGGSTSGEAIGSDGGEDLVFYAGPQFTERMRIENLTGNVGIGTTNPETKLDVAGEVLSNSFTINDIPTARWRLNNGGYDLHFQRDTDGTNFEDEVTFFDGGHAAFKGGASFGGGGTFNGSLTVSGDATFAGRIGALDLWNNDNSGGASDRAGIKTWNTLAFYSTYDGGHHSAADYGILFSPRDGGAIFKGTITTKEIIVTQNVGADFVFAKDYNLRPLDEVEQFIQKKGHLPEIPSAEEMQSNGVNVSQMQSKLLQKVEELTLYVIDLKKENDVLKKEVSSLKKSRAN